MAMHRRTESSMVHQWLRKKIIDIVRRFDKKVESGDPYRDYKVGQQMPFYVPPREE
jgi:hypothetical protein